MSIGKTILSVLALAVVGLADVGFAAEPRYVIIDLGTLGGWSSVALGINDLGQLVGSADTPAGLRHAFLWDPDTREMTDLGTIPPEPQSEASDINNLGQVVGISTFAGDLTSAFLWEEGTMINLGHVTGNPNGDTGANAINDAGQIVGRSAVGLDEAHAFLWEDGVMTDLAETYGVGGSAADINRFGDIIVGSKLLYANGTVLIFPTLGGEITIGLSLNDLTQVVGISERIAGQRIFHAFLWDDGEMIDLGALGGFTSSRAGTINNSGQVLGAPTFLYDPNEGMMSLYDLIPTDSGWSALSAGGLNNPGQIVGVGTFSGRRHAFLMTPIAILPCAADETDCQGNGIPDECDVELGFSEDCNANQLPDECDLAGGSSADCNNTTTPDECDIDDGTSQDCNANLVPDECDLAGGSSADCNNTATPDECDIHDGTSQDCNANQIPDECEPDCNNNDVADDCELDSDGDGVIDDCDGCPVDPNKTSPAVCGCNSGPGEEDDNDGDNFANCIDTCDGVDDGMFGPCEADEIPTVSAWGLVVMTLMLLAGAKVWFRRRESM